MRSREALVIIRRLAPTPHPGPDPLAYPDQVPLGRQASVITRRLPVPPGTGAPAHRLRRRRALRTRAALAGRV